MKADMALDKEAKYVFTQPLHHKQDKLKVNF